jgi:hypothetical protein
MEFTATFGLDLRTPPVNQNLPTFLPHSSYKLPTPIATKGRVMKIHPRALPANGFQVNCVDMINKIKIEGVVYFQGLIMRSN